jgi:hypothetical protein
MKQFSFIIALITMTLSFFGQKKIESLQISWPEEYKWKMVSDIDDKKSSLFEMIPGKDNPNNWNMFVSLMQLKNVKILNTDKVVQIYKESSRKESPRAKFTILEKNDTTKNKSIVFKIEIESFPDDVKPESQLYYVIQGESTLYVNYIAVKEKELKDEFVNKWSATLKTGVFVYGDAPVKPQVREDKAEKKEKAKADEKKRG